MQWCQENINFYSSRTGSSEAISIAYRPASVVPEYIIAKEKQDTHTHQKMPSMFTFNHRDLPGLMITSCFK